MVIVARPVLKQEGSMVYYPWLIYFIAGWWGVAVLATWGAADKPLPGEPPLPWRTLVVGVLGGIAAVFAVRFGGVNSDPMPGIVLAIATGGVVYAVLGPMLGAMKTAR